MTAPSGIEALDLPPPGALTAEIALDAREKARLARILSGFLDALDAPDPQRRVEALNDVAQLLDPPQTRLSQAMEKDRDMAEFDRYFDVRRVSADRLAPTLTRGLVTAALSGSRLSLRAPHLCEDALARQRAGFAAHARLLARVFGLGAL